MRLSQFVPFCYQGLNFSRAVQCPPSSIVRKEVRWWREAQQTQTQQPLKEHFPPPCLSDCSENIAWHGYKECDYCCENRAVRKIWRFKEQLMLAYFQHLCEVGQPGEEGEVDQFLNLLGLRMLLDR